MCKGEGSYSFKIEIIANHFGEKKAGKSLFGRLRQMIQSTIDWLWPMIAFAEGQNKKVSNLLNQIQLVEGLI